MKENSTLDTIETAFSSRLEGVFDPGEFRPLFQMAAESVLNCSRTDLLLRRSDPLSAAEVTRFEKILGELANARPIQYILGEADFAGLKFRVNQHVLIPRPETEELVACIVNHVKGQQNSEPAILDIGTGTGCIAISLAQQLAEAKVHAFDISTDALLVAVENAKQNGVDVEFCEYNILLDTSNPFDRTFDLIVSNPPYVRASEQDSMHPNVVKHEPHLALFVPDENPLRFYDAIGNWAQRVLAPGGWLFFEINEALGEPLLDLFSTLGYHNTQLYPDLQGKNRMLSTQWLA